MQFAPQKNNTQRIEGEFGEMKTLRRSVAQEPLHFIGLFLVQEEFQSDVGIKEDTSITPPFKNFVLEFPPRCIDPAGPARHPSNQVSIDL